MSQKIKSITTETSFYDDYTESLDTETTTRHYDKEQRLIRMDTFSTDEEGLPCESFVQYTYDSEGRIATIEKKYELKTYSYSKDDEGNDVIEQRYKFNGETIRTYFFNPQGKLIKIIYEDPGSYKCQQSLEYLDDDNVRLKAETYDINGNISETKEDMLSMFEVELLSEIFEQDSFDEDDILPEKTEYWDED